MTLVVFGVNQGSQLPQLS